MKGFAALIVIFMVSLGIVAILSFVIDRHQLRETFSGLVVEKSVKYHHTADGGIEMLWVLTLQDDAGRRFGRLVTETFFHQTAVGDMIRKDAGSDIRRMT